MPMEMVLFRNSNCDCVIAFATSLNNGLKLIYPTSQVIAVNKWWLGQLLLTSP